MCLDLLVRGRALMARQCPRPNSIRREEDAGEEGHVDLGQVGKAQVADFKSKIAAWDTVPR